MGSCYAVLCNNANMTCDPRYNLCICIFLGLIDRKNIPSLEEVPPGLVFPEDKYFCNSTIPSGSHFDSGCLLLPEFIICQNLLTLCRIRVLFGVQGSSSCI